MHSVISLENQFCEGFAPGMPSIPRFPVQLAWPEPNAISMSESRVPPPKNVSLRFRSHAKFTSNYAKQISPNCHVCIYATGGVAGFFDVVSGPSRLIPFASSSTLAFHFLGHFPLPPTNPPPIFWFVGCDFSAWLESRCCGMPAGVTI